MTSSRTQQGDAHNFGRRVEVRGERVAKPRTLLWEWLVLAADSPLRGVLADAAEREGLGRGAFGFLPALRFFPGRSGSRSRSAVPSGTGGEVERITLAPLRSGSGHGRRLLPAIVGRSLALWSWLGVTDLHWENLVLGVDETGNVVFTPLDIEMILADLALPTHTKLLPDADPEYADICRHACGVRRVLPYLGKPIDPSALVQMAAAYRGTLGFLDRHSRAIADVFAKLPALRETPIRVCLRGTGDYVNRSSEPLWPPLLDAEVEQLDRGDIPYFFRLYGRRGIHYYGDRALTQRKRLPLNGDVPQLDPILGLSRGLRSPSRKKLREEGLFTVLGAFDHESFSGVHRADGLEVAFRARSLVVKLSTGEELQCSRNLASFVGSVYLPCRCGEVRSVFVPPVTRCAL